MLAGLAAASMAGTSALSGGGPRTRRVGGGAPEAFPTDEDACHARQESFDLHAGLVIGAGQRERLEPVCRYVLRPPVAEDRLTLTAEGDVQWSLRRPWRDGTTALVFSPRELLERLAVLVPKPRINLLAYFGVLGARSAWRREVTTRFLPAASSVEAGPEVSGPEAPEAVPTGRGLRWAALMQRTFTFDVLMCPRCGGRLRLIALLEQTAVVERILRHLGLPSEIPAPRPARAPPDDDWRLAS